MVSVKFCTKNQPLNLNNDKVMMILAILPKCFDLGGLGPARLNSGLRLCDGGGRILLLVNSRALGLGCVGRPASDWGLLVLSQDTLVLQRHLFTFGLLG